MFAPRVAKPGSAAAQHLTVAAQWPSRSSSEQTFPPRRSISNQAMPGLVAQHGPGFLERRRPSQELAGRSADSGAPSASGDSSSIAVFPPNQTHQPPSSFPHSWPPPADAIQAKLTVGEVDDPLEHEADRIADQVMRVPAPTGSAATEPTQPSRNFAASEEGRLQQKQAGPQTAVGEAQATVLRVLRAPGQPLDAETRAFMEPRFGHDFGDVRVHSDVAAAQSAQIMGAAAYTAGREVVFAADYFAPGTPAGRRLIAHELAHVVQQRRVAPFLQRDPLPLYKSTDPVIELKQVFKPEREAWQLTLEGDFTTPEAVGRLIWPSRGKVPPGVSIKPIFVVEVEGWPAGQERKPPAGHAQRGIFELTGVELWTLRSMDPLFAKLFADLGLIEESKEVQEARAAFRAKHPGHSEQVLNNIDAALKRVTSNNPDLLVAYYRFYADWKLTDDIKASSSDAGETDKTIRKGGFTNINAGVLHRMQLPQLPTDDTLSLLGETLIHEYAHTSHASDYLPGPGEGRAYGIENFFAERLGDKKRDEATLDLGPRKGDKKAFDTSYAVMKSLYEVIDTQTSRLASLKGISPQRAREMAVEFISKNKQDFSNDLKTFIIAEFGRSGYDSLPSQESR